MKTRRFTTFIGAAMAVSLFASVGCGGDTVFTELFAATLDVEPVIEGNSFVGDAANRVPIDDPQSCVVSGFPSEPNHIQVFRLINEYRVENGLNPVKYSFRLQDSADLYALAMHDGRFFAHIDPSGADPFDRALEAGYCGPYVGENIAYGRNRLNSPAQVMQAFKDSPVHNENLLDARWDYVGVGYLRVTRLGVVESWWVQEFGVAPVD